MSDRFLYLSIDLLAISIPLGFSFYPKAPFYKKWKFLLPSIIIPGLVFILWDIVFTDMGIWGFNPRYVSGIYLANLPIEELLFFICIPYACVFTYEALRFLLPRDFLGDHRNKITGTLIFILFITGTLSLGKWYTSVTFLSTAVFLLFTITTFNFFLGRFYFSFLVILVPFFIVNGVLTGSGIEDQVVWYNNEENLGIRIGTIPIEDIFYGMLLLLMNVYLFELFQKRYPSTSV
ncbi:MAG: lycopene cyclase domain-containing protein [Flammeovirgaceae bacterium]|nr:lycopene cyclase domain-containing protein [Flammeovirgaceae bacterium]